MSTSVPSTASIDQDGLPVDAEMPSTFDVYARSFVPQSLVNINALRARVINTAPLVQIDFRQYRNFLHFLVNPERPSIQGLVLGHGHRVMTLDATDLSPKNYASYFIKLLSVEVSANREELESQNLYDVQVSLTGMNGPQVQCVLRVPGLNEHSPRIATGDVVGIRQLDTAHKIQYHHNAIVHGIDRAGELLHITVNSLHPRSMRFNVLFQIHWERVNDLCVAVAMADESLTRSGTFDATAIEKSSSKSGMAQQAWLQHMLFPKPEDGTLQTSLNPASTSRTFFDAALNFEQRKAVEAICKQGYGHVPFLISGPPGTGKTKTLVETTLQLVASGATALLVCAPSDPAADTLALRLKDRMRPQTLFRLNAPSRTFEEVPATLLPFCHIENDAFMLPPINQLLAFSVVVTTCRDASLLVSAGLTNQDLFRSEHGIHALIHPQRMSTHQYDLHWTGLLIDEAAQAIEPEALIPLAVITPPPESHLIKTAPFFVMAGDQKQLGPRTSSRHAAVQMSLFERLFNRTLYQDHPLARSRIRGERTKVLTKEMLPIIRPPFENLIRNYRSHPAILVISNSLFYHDTLVPEASGTESLLGWSGWRGRVWPVLFSPHEGKDEIERDGGGWYNISEARQACQYAHSLVMSGLIQEQDICIMSPFRAQVRVLRNIARSQYKMWNVNIGPLEAFQGLESRAVILCTTRSRTRFVEQDRVRGFGVIHESKRFNVAITRAMQGLIVLGTPTVLEMDENWGAFLAFCKRHGLWDSSPGSTSQDLLVNQLQPFQNGEPNGFSAAGLSALERMLLYKDWEKNPSNRIDLSFAPDLEDDMWLSGMAAELNVRGSDEPFDAESSYDETEEAQHNEDIEYHEDH